MYSETKERDTLSEDEGLLSSSATTRTHQPLGASVSSNMASTDERTTGLIARNFYHGQRHRQLVQQQDKLPHCPFQCHRGLSTVLLWQGSCHATWWCAHLYTLWSWHGRSSAETKLHQFCIEALQGHCGWLQPKARPDGSRIPGRRREGYMTVVSMIRCTCGDALKCIFSIYSIIIFECMYLIYHLLSFSYHRWFTAVIN